jgi:hypothetical protein
MIDKCLDFLKAEINTYLFAKTANSTMAVDFCKIVNEVNGTYAFPQDTIGGSVINIEEERILRNQLPDYIYKNNQHVIAEPALKINLYLIFAANFQHYNEGMKYLSYLLMFFQANPAFTPDKYPALDPGFEMLTAELISPSFEQLNQIWMILGSKQLPSIFYKVRMIQLQDDSTTGIQKPITKIEGALHSI